MKRYLKRAWSWFIWKWYALFNRIPPFPKSIKFPEIVKRSSKVRFTIDEIMAEPYSMLIPGIHTEKFVKTKYMDLKEDNEETSKGSDSEVDQTERTDTYSKTGDGPQGTEGSSV